MSEQEQEQAIIPITGDERGLQVRSLDEMRRWALFVVDSGLAPDCFQTASQVIVATQYGRELGFSLMQGLRSIAVVNGRPQIWGDAALALVKQSGTLKEFSETLEGEGDKMVARTHSVRVYPTGLEDTVDTEFSVNDAKTAGLWGKKGTWKTHPKRMLKYKSRAFNLRDNFPDILCGLHLVEEMEGEEYEALPAPTCDTPKRADRKPAGDVTVTDTPQTITESPETHTEQPETTTLESEPFDEGPLNARPRDEPEPEPADAETLKAMYAGAVNTFNDLVFERNANFSLGKLKKLFVEFATFTLMVDANDLPGEDEWTMPLLTTLNAELAKGLPAAITEMIPVEENVAE